ncbi:MAG: class I SAM-dependent methyltransferase [Deltaproteobacteria bacterium]|nr:class I SAM-dependent methyltransferase [Deltaproteobacteria bacterium]
MSKQTISPAYDRIIKNIQKKLTGKIQIPFTLTMWDGSCYKFGEGSEQFRIVAKNRKAMAVLISLDELRIGEAYMNGDIDFEGDMPSLISLRNMLVDVHPLLRLWRFIIPVLTDTLKRNRHNIATHYDYDSNFYLSFMDSSRCYSQAVFSSDDEPLECAQARKFDFAIESCRLRPGDNVLDVGGGWGSFTEYAGKKGINVTSLTISTESEKFITELIKEKNLPCRVFNVDFLAYRSDVKYDAIVVLGVMEHLPDYPRVIRQFNRFLKPGGRVYLDASATDRKFESPVFITRYIFPSGHSFFCLHDFLTAVSRENFEAISVINDRKNYLLTCKAWAQKLDRSREEITKRWGEHLYRMFRIYLWGSVYGFHSHGLVAYRVVLEKYGGND